MAKTSVNLASPDARLLVKDQYSEQTLQTANNYTVTSRVSGEVADYVSSRNLTVKSITDDILSSSTTSVDGVSINNNKLKSRISRALGIPTSTDALAGPMGNKIAKSVSGITGVGSVQAIWSGGSILYGAKDVDNCAGLVDTINKIVGNDSLMQLVDLGGIGGTIGPISEMLMESGAVDIIDQIVDKYKEAAAKNALLEDVAIRAARSGSVSNTRHFLEKMGHGRAYNIRTQIYESLLPAYRIADNETRGHIELAADLLALLTWLDPLWDRMSATDTRINLSYYMLCSGVCAQVLYHSDKRRYAAAGYVVVEKNAAALVKETFPELKGW